MGLAVTLKNYWSGWRYCKRYVHIVVHIVQTIVFSGKKSFFLKKKRMGGGIANDMYNNDVGKGVVYAYEAYEAK